MATRHELQIDPALLLKGFGISKALPVIMKSDGKLLLLVNLQLIYVIDETLRVLDEIAIENSLPYLKDLLSSRFEQLYPEPIAGFSDANIVPLFFPGNRILASDATRYMALLQINTEQRRAAWLNYSGQCLFNFDPADYPSTLISDGSPYVHHAIWKDGTLHIYTIGNSSGYVQWGMEYFGISSYDAQGRFIGHAYLEKHPAGSPKKHGRMGNFSSSLNYCILTPFYPTSDPWKRHQRLFDLQQGVIREIFLPKGYVKYRIVDHAHDTFWLFSREAAGHFQIAAGVCL